MLISLPASVVDAYRTCELLTVGRDGTPIAWPVIPVRRPDGTILVTTSIAMPQKALNVRRDPRVALLFSDPTASGLTAPPPQVLVQGTAVCPEEISVSAAPTAELWRLLDERQPSSAAYRKRPLRGLMDWYYMRLLITVTPAAMSVLPALPAAGPLNPGRASAGPLAEAALRLPQFTSGVIAGFDEAGSPTLVRVRPAVRDGALVFPADGLRPGRASLLCHRHDDELVDQRSFVVTGDLAADGDGWRLVPDRFVRGAEKMGPAGMVRTIRAMRAAARRYLDRRGLARPTIPWDEYGR